MIPYADNNAPLSFSASYGQEAMWVHRQIHSTNKLLHNLLWQIKFSGPLDTNRLTNAVQMIVNRHEPLRSSFRVVNDNLLQIVLPAITVTCPLEDLSSLHPEEKDSSFHIFAQGFGQLSFDIDKPPLVRLTLVKLEEEEHRLLVLFHHLVTDGSSWPLFFNELTTFYAGEALPSLSQNYGGYAARQKCLYAEGAWNRHREYWLDRFSGGVPVLEIPLTKPRPVDSHSRGGVCEEIFPIALKNELKALAKRNQSTLFRVLLAGCVVLLYRLTGQNNIVLGTALTGRPRNELKNLIGLFVDLAPLNFVLEDGSTFLEVLKKVHGELDGAVAHEEYPYPLVVQDINPVREIGRESLIPVTFIKLPASVEKCVGNLHLKEERIFLQLSQQNIRLYSQEIPEGIRMVCEYATDRFDRAAVRRLMVHFRTLLEGITANHEFSIDDLPLLTEFERHQILEDWNDTGREYPRNTCIHELFESQAKRTPEGVAVELEGDLLTYRKLDERANQLAHHLRKLGVGPEVLVALCVERSLEMMVGLLGILKAGGAYVPLDPEYPRERLSFIMEDTQAPVLVTQERLREVVPLGMAKIVSLDGDWQAISVESVGPLPASGVNADNLAYVMYTSGSTGKPKGVEIPHRGVIRLVVGNDYTLFDEQQSFLQLAPISFDASTFEIWGALLHGAKCVLYPDRVPNANKLGETIRQHGVTTLWLTASLFNAFIDDAPDVLRGVSRILTGGEQLSPQHIRRAYDRLPNTSIINGYGPTESTTFTTSYSIPAGIDGVSAVPIGRPIANTEVYILDRNLKPMPVGVPGELYIGGDGLARGYINRPDLTMERFISNPYRNEGRLYKTGDLVRYCIDGTIDFLSRLDHQVKIRGFRIEPGEIEVVLSRHQKVRAAIVVPREDRPGEKLLVAYVIPIPETVFITNELRNFLINELPEYMVPSAFVELDTLPLTPNGKVDLRALPTPHNSRSDTASYTPPNTPLEHSLADIWATILGLEKIGVDDNFFDLGGHSLLAMKLFLKINDLTGANLPLATLLSAPTVKSMAMAIERLTNGFDTSFISSNKEAKKSTGDNLAFSWRSLVPINPDGNSNPLFLCHAAGGNVLNYYTYVKYLGLDQPIFGLQARGLDGITEPFVSIEKMASHFIEEIQSIRPHGPYLLGGGSFGGMVAFEMARQLERLGEKVKILVLFDTFGPDSGQKELFAAADANSFLSKIRKKIVSAKHPMQIFQIFWHSVVSRTINKYKKSKCTIYQMIHFPIPLNLREWYITNHNIMLLKKYDPKCPCQTVS